MSALPPPAHEDPQVTTPRERGLYALLFGGLCLLVIAMVLIFELDPSQHPSPRVPFVDNGAFNHAQIMYGLMTSCAIGAVGVLVWGIVRRWAWSRSKAFQATARVLLVVTVFTSGFSYFYARRGMWNSHYAHRYDTFHYLLHPRYYAELDYADLYVCAIEALSERDMPDKNTVRDLRTYRMSKAGDLREQDLCPKERFTPERWERFEADFKVFTDTRGGASVLREAIADRGYNGTPFHAAVSGFIADRIPLTIATHNMVPLADVIMTSLMLYAAAAAFGWQTGLLFALSVFAMAADRWGIIGGSWFRFAWYATLTAGIAALRRGRYAWSGVWMTLSALLNIFPAVFSVGIVIRGLVTCWQEKRIVPRYKRFALAAAITAVIGLGVGALPARHLGNYTGWVANMEHHQVERFQGFGTGLKFPFIYRGANDAKSDKVPESQRKKLFHENRKAYYPLAFTLLGLAVAFAVKTRDDVEAATVLGFTIFFGFLGTVGYYFACASVLVLGLHRRATRPGGIILLTLWFVSSILAHWALLETYHYRFMYNTVLSLSWSVWLIGLLFWLASEEGILKWLGQVIAPPAPAEEAS